MKRKRLTSNQRADLLEKHKRVCHRCKQPIDPVRERWHVGHVIDLACGGSDSIDNMAPEHARCNLGYAASTGNAMAAKVKRVRNRALGIRRESRFPNARTGKWATRWDKEARRWRTVLRED